LCIKKIKRWKHYLFTSKIKRLSYFVLSGLLFIAKRNLFTSNRWFCWPVWSLPPTAFIGFHEDRLGGTVPQQSTGRKFPLVFPLKNLFWDGLVLTVESFMPWE
jgi:hypothetical protein